MKRILKLASNTFLISLLGIVVSILIGSLLRTTDGGMQVPQLSPIIPFTSFFLVLSLLSGVVLIVTGWGGLTGQKFKFRHLDIWMFVLAHCYVLFVALAVFVSRNAWNGILG